MSKRVFEQCRDCEGAGEVCVGSTPDTWYEPGDPIFERCPTCDGEGRIARKIPDHLIRGGAGKRKGRRGAKRSRAFTRNFKVMTPWHIQAVRYSDWSKTQNRWVKRLHRSVRFPIKRSAAEIPF